MYGLTKEDLEYIKTKHDYQKKYLENNYFVTANGQVKTLLDVSHSANHSERYYSEMQNKLNTIQDFINTQIEVNYVPIFLTITLDGFFRGFLYGDFSKYYPGVHKKLIPNNERFGFLQDKIIKKEKFTIKDLYNCLNFQWLRFLNSNVFKQFKKDNIKIHYIKTAEPHKKDGVPHFHLLVYCPSNKVELLKEYYKRYFPAPQNIRKLKKGSNDLKGFQTDLYSPLGYILKYVLKSFRDVKNEAEIDYLQAWYIKNRILRIVTSHSTVPMWVYRKLLPLEKDLYNLNFTFKENLTLCEWSKEDDYISITNEHGRTLQYNQGQYKLFYHDGKIIKESGEKKEFQKPIFKKIELKYKKKIKQPKIIIEGQFYKQIDNHLVKLNYTKPINYRTNLELYQEYKKLNTNIDSVNLKYYAIIKNELINRQFIDEDLISPNLYNTDIY